MSTVWLTVELAPGSTTAAACIGMVDLARKLGICIQANFNGVTVMAFPQDRAIDLEQSLNAALSSRSTIATTRRQG